MKMTELVTLKLFPIIIYLKDQSDHQGLQHLPLPARIWRNELLLVL